MYLILGNRASFSFFLFPRKALLFLVGSYMSSTNAKSMVSIVLHLDYIFAIF
jgi:hypothetical protein